MLRPQSSGAGSNPAEVNFFLLVVGSSLLPSFVVVVGVGFLFFFGVCLCLGLGLIPFGNFFCSLLFGCVV